MAAQTDSTVRLYDDSDWWSASRTLDADESIKTQERELPRSNFEILGIRLNEHMFEKAAARLGTATTVERGDAATGRHQVCYVSTQNEGKVYLIFERVEVDFTFYLFAGGPGWNGSDRCTISSFISRSVSTASGLHLGQTPSQVIAILGPPSNRRKNELVYSLPVEKKVSPKERKRLRLLHPQLSGKEIRDDFDSYDLGAGIGANFVDSKLTRLTVSTAETN
jgi:hypothetical protein